AGCIQSSTTARQAIHLLIFFIFHQWERTFFPVLPTFGLFLKTDNKNSILSIGSDNGRQIDPDKIVQFLSPHQNERGVDPVHFIQGVFGLFSHRGGICRRHRPHKCRDIDFVILFEQLAAVRIFRTSTSCKYENRQRNHRQQSEYPA
ncbi:MAG: hypothetical protein ACLTLS_04995, partial [Alistipes onderdonkii]